MNLSDSCVTVGAFDGIHLGHRALLTPFLVYAHKWSLPTVMITFDPLPSVYFQRNGNQKNIILPKERAELLTPLGIDYLITLKFDQRLASESPDAFLSQMKEALNMKSLWVGADFSLGKDRSGTIEVLCGLAKKYKFDLRVIPQLEMDDDVVSSTRIRKLLSSGKLHEANKLLGYPYFFENTIIHGEARGRRLGFPTINMRFPDEKIVVSSGVYAARIIINGHVFSAVTNVGVRPTFHNDDNLVVESYILDNHSNLYGESAKVEFVEFLRNEVKFQTADDLIAQIQNDIENARSILK
ncbi:MAG: bifunctional riboflavin kinase/FAD synthetase [Flexilinea sp.]